jgi:hypothetical protein
MEMEDRLAIHRLTFYGNGMFCEKIVRGRIFFLKRVNHIIVLMLGA